MICIILRWVKYSKLTQPMLFTNLTIDNLVDKPSTNMKWLIATYDIFTFFGYVNFVYSFVFLFTFSPAVFLWCIILILKIEISLSIMYLLLILVTNCGK